MDLSILIPARNEEFLGRTIQNILENIEGKTEIIAVLDGYWPNPPIIDDPRVILVHLTTPIGQRAATNLACRISKAKYIMKVDAHCAFDKGFDVKMMKDMQDDWTMVPTMRNLHAFDWVCPEGHRRYQSPSGSCTECGKETQKDILWIAKERPQSNAYRFDTDMHFQYWQEFADKQTGHLTDTLSIQGSCFMVTREKYWELDICSEEFHSWGQQGVEVACKTWLSGGRVVVNRNTWYAHMFRTQGGDFSFPYENPQSKVVENRERSKELFMNNTWPKAIHDFQWLLDKFNPPGWEKPTKGIIYYTDNQLNLKIAHKARKYIKNANLPIVSASLKPMDFGTNIHVNLERGYLTMFKQILAALEASTADIVFFCEHDVFYHPSHFEFTPPKRDVFYYNTNVWKVRLEDGHALWCDNLKQVSGLCAYRELLIEHYKNRVERVEREGYNRNMGFEPGTHGLPGGIDNYQSDTWMSKYPNLDVRHDKNLTPNRWRKDQFRHQKNTQGWTESHVSQLQGWEGRLING